MARSIVLRFDATCFDCGRSLSAGSTARWFGKGRVSCCGDAFANRAAASSFVPASAVTTSVTSSKPLPMHNAIPACIPSPELEQLARDTGIELGALASGLTADQVAILAQKTPNQRLIARLQSGARCIVPAVYAAHVIRCVEESCIDRVRDVSLLADKYADGGQ
jgi:hypothetical protein